MMERFERLAEKLLAQAEVSDPTTRSSRLELRAALARAAAECSMAASMIRMTTSPTIKSIPVDYAAPAFVPEPMHVDWVTEREHGGSAG